MLEVGNGGMSTAEYRTHFTMWAAIKSPLIMGNKLDQLTPEDYAILTNPAVLALSQDPSGSAIQRRLVRQLPDKDQWGFGNVQIWSGSLWAGDYVVVFLNAGNSTQTISASLVEIFGGLATSEQAQVDWEYYDLWADNVTIPADVAAGVLNGTAELGGDTPGYYNATEMSWADGLARNDSRLLGSYAGKVAAQGTVTAEVGAHDVAAWRFREVGKGSGRKDEL